MKEKKTEQEDKRTKCQTQKANYEVGGRRQKIKTVKKKT